VVVDGDAVGFVDDLITDVLLFSVKVGGRRRAYRRIRLFF